MRAMVVPEAYLEVAHRRRDKARRLRVAAAMLALAVVGLLFLAFQVGAFGVAWRAGMIERALTMAKLGQIRAEGLAATRCLNDGDVDGAGERYARLLAIARPLAAFHATHVLMFGVTRFFQGDSGEALRLADRALASGWFEHPRMQGVAATAKTWRVIMLLASGDVEAAKRHLEVTPPPAPTARIAVALYEERWDDALGAAKAALDDADTRKEGRPTLAALGLYAAKKLDRTGDVAALEAVLAREPAGPLLKKNPALGRFL